MDTIFHNIHLISCNFNTDQTPSFVNIENLWSGQIQWCALLIRLNKALLHSSMILIVPSAIAAEPPSGIV